MMRESKISNDLFFVCSVIDYVARKTKNTRKDTVNTLGMVRIRKLYDLADVYHCENIDKVTDELIEDSGLQTGEFDNVGDCMYSVPSFWDIGRVYRRLILRVSEDRKADEIEVLFEVYNSWISEKIDNYNSSMYYENPGFILESYKAGHVLEE